MKAPHHRGEKSLSQKIRNVSAALVALLGVCNVNAEAAQAKGGGWQYEVTLYGWYSGIDGTLKFPGPRGVEEDLVVDASDILDNLEMTFMGSLEARYNRWSIITDVIYLHLGDDATTTLTVGPDPGQPVNASADIDLTSWVVNGGVSYDVIETDGGRLAVVGGVRYMAVDIDGTFSIGGPFPVDKSESVDIWNGIVGLRGYIQLNERWYLPYYLDVGTGDSDFTWQMLAGVGYRFGWGDVRLGYRYLSIEQGDDELIEDLAISGPVIGVGFRF